MTVFQIFREFMKQGAAPIGFMGAVFDFM